MSARLQTEFELREVLPILTEVLESGGEFRIYPRGISMLPLLHEGEDSVLLTKCTELTLNGMYLYRRKNGRFVLHRLVAFEKNGDPVFRGDNQTWLERGITRADVIATVCGIFKKDVEYSLDSRAYRAYLRRLSSPVCRFFRFLPRRIKGKLSQIKSRF